MNKAISSESTCVGAPFYDVQPLEVHRDETRLRHECIGSCICVIKLMRSCEYAYLA